MEGDILFRVSRGFPSFVEDGEVFRQQVSTNRSEEVLVEVYGKVMDKTIIDEDYSSPLVRRVIGHFSCRFVDTTNSNVVLTMRRESVQLEIAVDRLCDLCHNRCVAIVETSRVYIGDVDNGTDDMLRNLKVILNSVAQDALCMYGDVAVWWYLNDAELSYIKEHKGILPKGSRLVDDCKALVIL